MVRSGRVYGKGTRKDIEGRSEKERSWPVYVPIFMYVAWGVIMLEWTWPILVLPSIGMSSILEIKILVYLSLDKPYLSNAIGISIRANRSNWSILVIPEPNLPLFCACQQWAPYTLCQVASCHALASCMALHVPCHVWACHMAQTCLHGSFVMVPKKHGHDTPFFFLKWQTWWGHV